MRKTILASSLIFIGLNAYAESIDQFCLSKSGKSSYHINLDTNAHRGVLDYEFMGQKVSYKISEVKQEKAIFTGIAEFLSSKTGESKGNSFVFTYDSVGKTFSENNMVYHCN